MDRDFVEKSKAHPSLLFNMMSQGAKTKDGLAFPFLRYRSKYAAVLSPLGEARHIFYQAHDGSLNEVQAHGSGWYTRSIIPRGVASMGSPIAAISWGPSNDWHVRVYFVSLSFQLREITYENGVWSEGGLDANGFEVDGSSNLAATFYKNGDEIRLYYQTPDFRLREIVYSKDRGGWKYGHQFEQQVMPGSSLAFVNLNAPADDQWACRGYFQDSLGKLREVCIDWGTGWFNGSFQEDPSNTVFLTPLAAVAHPRNGTSTISVFYLDRYNNIVQKLRDQKEWARNILFSPNAAVIPGTCLAATSTWTKESGSKIWVYATVPLNALAQILFTGGAWHLESQGEIIPLNMKLSLKILADGSGLA